MKKSFQQEFELKDFYFQTHDKRHLTQEKRRYQYRPIEERGGGSTGLKKSSRLHIFQAHWVFSLIRSVTLYAYIPKLSYGNSNVSFNMRQILAITVVTACQHRVSTVP